MKSKNKCPNCNTILQFDRTRHETVKCPKCKSSAHISEYKEVEDENATEFPTDKIIKGAMYKPGILQFLESDVPWLSEDQLIILQRGENKIGRSSLPIKDNFMSREHTIIEVVFKSDATFAHYLRNDKNKNKTFHNNDPLEEGDIIKLLPNDTIRIGHTTLKFITS